MLGLESRMDDVFGRILRRIAHHHREIGLEMRGQGGEQCRIEFRLADPVRHRRDPRQQPLQRSHGYRHSSPADFMADAAETRA